MQPPNPLVSVWVMMACTGAQEGLSYDAQLHGVHSTCGTDHPDRLRHRFDVAMKSCLAASSCAKVLSGEFKLSSHAAHRGKRLHESSCIINGLTSQALEPTSQDTNRFVS